MYLSQQFLRLSQALPGKQGGWNVKNLGGDKCTLCCTFGLFITKNVYVTEGEIKGGRGATPTSISIFDSYDIKTL